jgi:hypothetical protein
VIGIWGTEKLKPPFYENNLDLLSTIYLVAQLGSEALELIPPKSKELTRPFSTFCLISAAKALETALEAS